MSASEHRFGTGHPFSLGVEEELFLVDPVTGRQIDVSAAVLERLGPVEGTVELHACQVELITEVCATAGEAAAALGALRRGAGHRRRRPGRAAHAIGGMGGLLRETAALTAATP
jgi:carboxylate-amine ligase